MFQSPDVIRRVYCNGKNVFSLGLRVDINYTSIRDMPITIASVGLSSVNIALGLNLALVSIFVMILGLLNSTITNQVLTVPFVFSPDVSNGLLEGWICWVEAMIRAVGIGILNSLKRI